MTKATAIKCQECGAEIDTKTSVPIMTEKGIKDAYPCPGPGCGLFHYENGTAVTNRVGERVFLKQECFIPESIPAR